MPRGGQYSAADDNLRAQHPILPMSMSPTVGRYGSERAFNGLRLAGSLAERESAEARVFLNNRRRQSAGPLSQVASGHQPPDDGVRLPYQLRRFSHAPPAVRRITGRRCLLFLRGGSVVIREYGGQVMAALGERFLDLMAAMNTHSRYSGSVRDAAYTRSYRVM